MRRPFSSVNSQLHIPVVRLKHGSANFVRLAAINRNSVITAHGGGVVRSATAPL